MRSRSSKVRKHRLSLSCIFFSAASFIIVTWFECVGAAEAPTPIEHNERIVSVKGFQVRLVITFSSLGCLPGWGGERAVTAHINSAETLEDDDFAKLVMEEGKNFFFQKCPQRSSLKKIGISIYDPRNRSAQGFFESENNFQKLRSYFNQASDEKRAAEQLAKFQQQRKLEGERMAKERAERETARQKRWNEFVRKYAVQEMIDSGALQVNPFVYQGKTVAIRTHFERMLSPDTGKFGDVIVSGLPRDLFRSRSDVVLAGRVLGTQESRPHLKFVGVHVCQDYVCSDLLAQR